MSAGFDFGVIAGLSALLLGALGGLLKVHSIYNQIIVIL